MKQKLPLKAVSYIPDLTGEYQNHPHPYQPQAYDDDMHTAWNSQLLSQVRPERYAEGQARSELESLLRQYHLTILASGAYGIACLVHKREHQILRDIFSQLVTTSTVGHYAIDKGQDVVLKFVRVFDAAGMASGLREIKYHSAISETYTPADATFPALSGKSIVPQFHFGGPWLYAGHWWVVTAMGLVRGVPLRTYLRTHQLTARLFAKIEKAVMTLWFLGFAHQDLHDLNIMYDANAKKVTLLDLGFAVRLPNNIVQHMRSKVTTQSDPADVYRRYIEAFASSIIWQREGRSDRGFQNPDGRVLRVLFNRLIDNENLVVEREKAWRSAKI